MQSQPLSKFVHRISSCAISAIVGVGATAALLTAIDSQTSGAQAASQTPLNIASIASLSSSPSLTFTGEATNNLFGVSVSAAGDVNNDGYGDVIIGADGYSSNKGRVYVFLGSANGLSNTASITITGEGNLDLFGYSAQTAGDTNGDGFEDIIVGAFGYSGFNRQGRAYLYLGNANGITVTAAMTLTGESSLNYFGQSAGTAGDVNKDSFADVIIGAPGYPGFSAQGRAYLYMGSANGLSTTPALTLTGESDNNSFGWSVGTAGDVNKDGYAEVFVTAKGYLANTGRVYIYHGSASGLSATPALTLTGQTANEFFGLSASTAGDINKDGYSDIIVGASGYMSQTGRAYVYLGGASGLGASPVITLTGQATTYAFGNSVGTAGDINDDGYSDVVIGAEGYLSSTGQAYLYFGTVGGLDSTPTITLTGENVGDHFGARGSTGGDVNRDGVDDFIIGAPYYLNYTGRAYLFNGVAVGSNRLYLPLIMR
jgi:hypothetical protein